MLRPPSLSAGVGSGSHGGDVSCLLFVKGSAISELPEAACDVTIEDGLGGGYGSAEAQPERRPGG